ncbi:nicotinate-nucleotide--dimethylbenzimidazole phosphoribosyltransferase [Pseudorhodoferax sp.]|jgi:nicotinate-nucleotide--dimethylbenzimidazole phosphoribosyltransferase|uniref:nicotinate-nucleotide--dimethylbenzimidazole phosphoribosyltransferase n=1 Tax=Pseudorhodoferax sp. TaxID=1993553 RepID=UPI001B5713A4|nr:nicotinate-nucleotide--dimethylbenzimidazole phosphoribosyltransferase [Pseudorhodoferax sp.]MBP8144249.1 nicotinate-nucleotide--dimethylbenzimidazole phosphoribosyltransferase [Inhella sp.]
MPIHESLISPTANPQLERGLRERLARHAAIAGGFGQLEALALRLGLMQDSLTPRFRDPVLTLFAGDHGLAVDGLPQPWGRPSHEQALLALQSRLPCAVIARLHGLQLQVVDCGLAQELAPHPKLLLRKVAHGTRNARVGLAMQPHQVQAALRVGMELADALSGNVLALAGLGQGSAESALLLLARIDARHLGEMLPFDAAPQLLELLQLTLNRHREALDPMDALAAFGGFEIAVMVGAMLVGASKRKLLLVDGLPACAALRVAAAIAAPVTDYAVFCRSSNDPGLDVALQGFKAGTLLELGLSTSDGMGAALAWPLLRSAAALLSDVHEGSVAPLSAPEPAPALTDPRDTVITERLDEASDTTLPQRDM